MDLNHARLPIPPRWQSNLLSSGGPKATESGRPTFLFYRHEATCQTIDWCRFTASVLCGPLPSLANMPQHSGRIHDISNPKPPWLHGWRARRLHFEFSRQVKSLNVRPPGVEIIHHELHHEVLSQFFLIIALKDETAGAGPENCYISIQKFFETQRLIETLRKRKVPCRYKWPRQFVSARNLQHPSPLNRFVAASRHLMNRRYCRRDAGSLPELRRHRNFRIQHLRHRTPFLRRFRILLERRSIRAWHFPHHVNMARRDRPSRIQLLHRERDVGVDALWSQLRLTQLRRQRHRKTRRMRRRNQLLGISPRSIPKSRSKRIGRIVQHPARRRNSPFSIFESALPNRASLAFHDRLLSMNSLNCRAYCCQL